MKIHHFGLEVKDIDISIKFYTEKLGFKIKTKKTTTMDGRYTYSYLELNGSMLELVQMHLKDKIQKNDNKTVSLCPHIGLESDDFEKDLNLLKQNKVKIFDGPHIIPNDIKILTILDPDGYRIDIGQVLK